MRYEKEQNNTIFDNSYPNRHFIFGGLILGGACGNTNELH